MSVQNGRAFNEWLRSQLKAKKMSQRQLAQQSGVDHSTISRLIRGDRTPSLGTATKLARGLREIHDEADTPQYFGLVASTATNPTARVEYSLRADEYLSEAQVRQVMEYYLAVRMRRLAAPPGRAPHPWCASRSATSTSSDPPHRRVSGKWSNAGHWGPAFDFCLPGTARRRRQAGLPSGARALGARLGLPQPLGLRREHVGDATQDDDRQDADGAVDEGDRGRLGQRHAVDPGQDAHDTRLHDAQAARREGYRGQE